MAATVVTEHARVREPKGSIGTLGVQTAWIDTPGAGDPPPDMHHRRARARARVGRRNGILPTYFVDEAR